MIPPSYRSRAPRDPRSDTTPRMIPEMPSTLILFIPRILLTYRVTDHQGNTRSAGSAYDEAQQKKQEAQQQKEQNKGEAKEQLKSHAQDLDNSRDPNASLSQQKDQVLGRADDKRSEAESEANRQSNRSDMPNDQGEAKDQARGKAEQLKNRIPEEHRERVDNAVQETKEFVHDVFPEERREQFIYRLKKVVVECQQHKDYQEAMEWLLTFFESKSSHPFLNRC